MKKAFSLIELFITIILLGIMAVLSINYYNTSTISKNNIKAELKSHFQIITTTILQCKELSGVMPLQNDGSYASNTLLDTMECNTTTPYALDGERGAFIPPSLQGFSSYKATQSGSEFYFSTSTDLNSFNAEVLNDLNSSYSVNQYELTQDATTLYMKFYLSR